MAFQEITSQAQVPFYIELEFCSKVQANQSSDSEEEVCPSQRQVKPDLRETLQIPTQSKKVTEFGSADSSPITPGRFAPILPR